MIKLENWEIVGWQHAIRGMRNPMNSWEKSDSVLIDNEGDWYTICGDSGPFSNVDSFTTDGEQVYIGPNDLKLMKTLVKAGTDHRKFMRMITVYIDITAPLYWWKEFDTYKVGTVANSCSTMHKIAAEPITEESFSFDHVRLCDVGKQYLEELEKLRVKFNKTKDKKYWYPLIQLLPSSYNQRRTVMLNYEVLANIYKSRKNHKLDEWRSFCEWIEVLPYSELITGKLNNEEDMEGRGPIDEL